jgi:hypothetical protein
MDGGTFYLVAVIVFGLGILALYIHKEIGPLFAFIGGVLGMLFFTSLNTDGSITNAYGYNGSTFSTSTVGIWPLGYLLIMFIILDFAIGLYLTVGKQKF